MGQNVPALIPELSTKYKVQSTKLFFFFLVVQNWPGEYLVVLFLGTAKL